MTFRPTLTELPDRLHPSLVVTYQVPAPGPSPEPPPAETAPPPRPADPPQP